ncbi:hypothetical protein [Aquabacterium humicola]|uniref:hypothetical protein n=1 Tax=Aquabacterium humicola TaxID=3237377 RepID=UPI0025431245|nr:hypothetical protein [Rubrivivax pictus]
MTRELLMPPAPVEMLGQALVELDLPNPMVVALPEGMLSACRIARALGAPFDVLVGPGAHVAPALTPELVEDYRALRLRGRAVVLIDDGAAEPASWAAALNALRAMRPDVLVAAAPRLQPAVAHWLAAQIRHMAGPLRALAA